MMAVCALALMTACGTPGTPHPPSLELVRPVDDLAAARKGSKVTLTWTPPTRTTDGQSVRERNLGPTWICRVQAVGPIPPKSCEVQVGQSPPAPPLPRQKEQKRPPAQPKPVFTVTLPQDVQQANPTGFANFAVEVKNKYARSAGLSNLVKVPLAPTLPPPSDFRAEVTADGVVLSWTGKAHEHPAPGIGHTYRIYRLAEDAKTPTVAAEVTLRQEPQAAFTDHNFEWEKKYQYWITVVTTVPGAEIEGDDSPHVAVFAHDVFPPAVPQGLEAVASGVGQKAFIDLTWTPDTDADLAGYYVYRQQQGASTWTKLNQQPQPAPAFRDNNVAASATYTYTVSAVDVRNNESARSQPASETVPAAER